MIVLVRDQLYVSDMPDKLGDVVLADLSIVNPEWAERVAQGMYLGGVPKQIDLWDFQDGRWILPRGYAVRLSEHAARAEVEIEWDDQRAQGHPFFGPAFRAMAPIVLRPHQGPAVERLLEREQGILEAPPAAGKTVATLEAIRRLGRPALVITNTTNIATQWAERAAQYLPGLDVGIIGDGALDTHCPITIAMVQTLFKRREELAEVGFFDWFGLVMVDECHHTPAETWRHVIGRFSARVRAGTTATPDRSDGKLMMATATLGGIIHRVEEEELIAAGFLARPRVIAIQTTFAFDFWPNHKASSYEACKVPGCPKSMKQPHSHRNNYASLLKELVADEERNRLIMRAIIGERGHACLVVSKRLNQLDRLYSAVLEHWGQADRVFMMTGREDTDERDRVSHLADQGDCVIFSTIANEALDIPRLDRLFLVWPTRAAYMVRQQVGRVARAHPHKKDSLVFDFADAEIGVLKRQFRSRLQQVYNKQHYPVDVLTPADYLLGLR